MVLLIDNYDSFTYMLRDYILQAGEECMVVRNDEMTMDQVAALSFDSIVISPGPKAPIDAGVTMEVIRTFYQSKPILGICLGHQALGEFFGARLVRARIPMHGKTTKITHTDHPIFHNITQQTEVMRYHSLILESESLREMQNIATTPREGKEGIGKTQDIATTPQEGKEGIGKTQYIETMPQEGNEGIGKTQNIASLRVIAQTGDGEVMGIAHRVYSIAGLQFHPESVLTAHGLDMIRNWFRYLRSCP